MKIQKYTNTRQVPAKTKKYRKRDYVGLAYIAPWLIGLVVLQLYPFITSFYYSFTDYQFFNSPEFTGLDNYIRLFTSDTEFFKSLQVTIIYTLFTVPGKIIMALFIALLLNRNMKGIGVIRTIYYIPSLFSGSVAVAILWKLLFMINEYFTVSSAFMTVSSLAPAAWKNMLLAVIHTILLA